MIVQCARKDGCGRFFDDEFRTTICLHEAFPANDGKNNFTTHDDAYLSDYSPADNPTLRGS